MATITADLVTVLELIRDTIADGLQAGADPRSILETVDRDAASLIARHQATEHADPAVYDWATAGDFGALSVPPATRAALGAEAARLSKPAA
jgi:hypothetical protein